MKLTKGEDITMIKLLRNHPTGPNIIFIPFLLFIIISFITGLIGYINTDINMLKICGTFLVIVVIISFYISYKQTNIKKTHFIVIRENDNIIIESDSNWVKSNIFQIFKEDENNIYVLDNNKIYTVRKNEINLDN